MRFLNKLLSLFVVLGITGMGASVEVNGDTHHEKKHHKTKATEHELKNLLNHKDQVAVIVVDPQQTFS